MRKPTDEKVAAVAKLIADYWRWSIEQAQTPVGSSMWILASNEKSKAFGEALRITGLSMARLDDCFESRTTWTELYNRSLMR